MFFKKSLIILLLLPNVILATGLGRNWVVNKDHSEILFEIPYLKFGKVTGRFSQFRGHITYDKDETLIEKISMVIFVDSINTGNNLRDGHLKSKDFFDIKNYPRITFNSSQISPLAPGKFKAIGELSIHGQTRQAEIHFNLSELVKDTWGKPSIMGNFSGKIQRKEYGLTWNKFIEKEEYLVGDQIKFYGQMQLQSRRMMTDSSKHLIPVNESLKKRNKILRGEESTDVIERGIIELKPTDNKNIKDKEVMDEEKNRSNTWWLAYFSMGFIGFLSIITLMFQGKQFFINIFRDGYEETGKWGFVSDIIVYSIGLVYVWAMWIIGFSG